MIIFLTLIYCGILALLVRLGVIKLTLWWKLSPLVWMLTLLILIFIPMQWGAPAGTVNVYRSVVEVVPNVSGEIIEVPVRGLKEIKKNDVLFQIDPVPYQLKVDRLSAQLSETIQNVEQLNAASEAADARVAQTELEIKVAQADEMTATAGVSASKSALGEAKEQRKKSEAAVDKTQIQLSAAQREYERIEALDQKNVATKSDLDRADIQVNDLGKQLELVKADVRIADQLISRAEADIQISNGKLASATLRVKQLTETELPRVKADAKEAKLAANSFIGDEHTSIALIRAELEQAKYDLEQTSVRAPSNGVVVAMSLRPGQRVTSMPTRSWMSFVPTEEPTIAVGISQFVIRHIELGQDVEVTFKAFPGRVFAGTVDGILPVNENAQVQPSGVVSAGPNADQQNSPFSVRIRLKDDIIDLETVTGGSAGTAAIYTKQVQATHIVRRIMLRMEAWMNYINPY